jgi:glycosyltransferase involved in cell wall biosynthesis
MKILHVTTHMNIGGIAQYIFSLALAMKRAGHDIIVASSGGNMEEELAKNGIPHRRLDIKTKFEFAPKVLFASQAITKIARQENVGLIHAHTRVSQVASMLASSAAGTRYVSTCHGFFKPRLSRRIFDTWGEKVVAISLPVKEHLVSDFGIDRSRIELIHNGVDTQRFSKEYGREEISEVKRSLGLGDGPVIGTMGRLSSVKGQRFLVEATRHIASTNGRVKCMIIGSGPELEPLKSFAKNLGVEDRMVFTGAIYKDIALYLRCMDVFVLPSVKEGLGLALLEAMASGIPCIASDVGGITDIVKSGTNGIVVPVANGVAIAEAAVKILKDAPLGAALSAKGRETVKEGFSMETMAGKMADLYGKVTDEKKQKI